MKNLDILTIINKKDEGEVIELINSYGKVKTLSSFAEVLDKRAYLTIDKEGNLKRKSANMALPIFAFFDDHKTLIQGIFDSANLKERQILDKIDRFSNVDMDKIKDNLIKTIFNGNLDFAKKYGKELFLRDREAFYNLLATFVTIGNSDSLKGLFLISYEKLMENIEYDGNIFFLFMAYITKFRDNTSAYETCENGKYSAKDLKKQLADNKDLLYSKLGLGILTNLYLVEKYNLTNEEKILAKLAFEINNYQELAPLSDEEKQILEFFL